jgi:hypothetical protein
MMVTESAMREHFEAAARNAREIVALAAFEIARDAWMLDEDASKLPAKLAAVGVPDDVANVAIDTLKRAAPTGLASIL